MFKIDGSLNRLAFIELSKQLSSFRSMNRVNKEVIIDLKDIIFSDPFGIIGLIIFTRYLYNNYGLISVIEMPRKKDVHYYLLKAGITKDEGTITRFLGRDISLVIRVLIDGLKNTGSDYSHINFIPVTDIANPDDIDNINSIIDAWMRNNNYDDSERLDVQVLVSEICQNVNHHSETLQNGVFLMQGYTRRLNGNTKHCMISIGDTGIGIKNSLSKNPDYKSLLISDDYAIDCALNKGWSSKEDNKFRGNGFSNLLRLSKKHNLNIYIHSHGGYLSYTYTNINDNNKSDVRRKRYITSINPIRGTQVCFELKSKIIL